MGISDLWKKEHGDRPLQEEEDVNQELLISGSEMTGRIVGGKYIIEDVLGHGGMGVLYLARHKVLGRKYVIKIIRLQLLDAQANIATKRFRREAQALAKVLHPNIVEIVDYDLIDDRTPYFVMEFVEGKTLGQIISETPTGVDLGMFVTIMEQVCGALEVVHEHGLVHRDLKPNNIMVQEKNGEQIVKLLDFGLVQVTSTEFESSIINLTGTGQVIGTPAYMSPEQCKGEDVDRYSDIYGLGLLAHEMLTGEVAMDGDTFASVIEKQLTEYPKPVNLIRSDVPDHISRAIQHAISKEPNDRFKKASDFWIAICGDYVYTTQETEAVPDQTPGGSNVMFWALFGGLLALALGMAYWLLF